MAKAHASAIIAAPIDVVWAKVRDFNAMPSWNPNILDSMIEDGLASDTVGCIRRFTLANGVLVRERLLVLDDLDRSFTYNFETPAFPVENYLATFRLQPVTSDDTTFATWSATFDEAADDQGRYAAIISTDVFAAGLASIGRALAAG